MTEELVRTTKKEIDENIGGLPPITGVKCKRCDKVHPIVTYFWKLDHKGNPSLKINILCPEGTDLESVFEAERTLSRIGIHFDTGYGGGRDWEFDWSLWGYHFQWNKDEKRYEPITERNEDMPKIQKINQCGLNVCYDDLEEKI